MDGSDRDGGATPGSKEKLNDQVAFAPWKALFFFTAKRHLYLAVPAILLSILAGCIIPAESYLYGRVFAEFAKFGSGDVDQRDFLHAVDKSALWLVVLGAVAWFAHGGDFSSWTLFGAVQAAYAREKLFMGMLDREIAWFDMRKHGVGALLARLNMYTLEFQAAVSIPLGIVFQNLTCAIVSLCVAFYFAWDLTLVTVSILPFATLAVWYCSIQVQPNIDGQADKLGEAAKHSTNAMSSIDSVKCFNGQDSELWKYMIVMDQASMFYNRQIYWNSAQAAILRFATLSMFVQGFWYGSHLVHAGKKDAGAVVTTFWSTMMATQAVMSIMPVLLTLEKGRMAGAKLRSAVVCIEEKPIRLIENPRITFQTCFGQINIRGLSFSYPARPEQPVLKNVSLEFPAGRLAFVVGKSGSGKSTIGQLMMRYYKFDEGSISFDGRSITEMSLEWLRDNVFLVEQTSVLFEETVARNIAFGRKDFKEISMDDVRTAARFAMLDQMIEDMPEGFATLVGAKGATLSGGQRQRMALARARIRDPPVVILDESTSALDQVNRMAVIENIRKWRRGKTTIIITHDIAQILPTDLVYLLEDGEVVEHGMRNEIERADGSHFRSFTRTDEPSLPEVEIVDVDADVNESLIEPAVGAKQLPLGLRALDDFGVSSQSISHLQDSLTSTNLGDPLDVYLNERYYRTSIALPSILSNGVGSSAYRETIRPISIASPLRKIVPSPASTAPTQSDQKQPSQRKWRRSTVSSVDFGRQMPDIPAPAAISRGSARYSRRLSTIPGSDASLLRLSIPWPKSEDPPMTGYSEAYEMKSICSVSPEEQIDTDPFNASLENASRPTGAVSLKSIFATLLPEIPWSFRCLLAFAVFWLLIYAVSTPIFSWIFAKLLETFYEPSNASHMAMIYSLTILGVAAVDAMATFCYQSQLCIIGQIWVNKLRYRGLRRILDQPRQFFSDPGNEVGRMAEVLDAMAEMMQSLVGRFFPAIIISSLMMSVAVVWSFVASWKLTLVGLAVMPGIYALTRAYDTVNSRLDNIAQAAVEVVSAVYTETFMSIKTVKSLTLEGHFSEKFRRANRKCLRAAAKRALVSGLFYGLAECSILFVTALLFHFGAYLAAHNEYTVSDIIIVFTELLFGLSNVQGILSMIPQMSTCRDAASRVLHLARLPELSFEHEGTTRITTIGDISFTNCSFSYPSMPGHLTLKDVTLHIPPGSCVALVGSSGSGKSTLASLLLKLYATPETPLKAVPMLALSGRDIKHIHTATLRSLITIVSQTPFLFPASIAENITYGVRKGSPHITPQAIRAAASSAGIHDFIMSLPDGYDTVVGEGGMGVSGGQAQRICIARALVRKPSVLILDEATSALDVHSAAVVRDTVRRLVEANADDGGPRRVWSAATAGSAWSRRTGAERAERLTVIVITHAKEMMSVADRVVMLERGRVVEQGGYDELIRKRGPFSRMIHGEEWSRESRAIQRRSMLMMDKAAGVSTRNAT